MKVKQLNYSLCLNLAIFEEHAHIENVLKKVFKGQEWTISETTTIVNVIYKYGSIFSNISWESLCL